MREEWIEENAVDGHSGTFFSNIAEAILTSMTTQMNVEGITPSEIGQTEKDGYSMFSGRYEIYISKSRRNREWNDFCQGLEDQRSRTMGTNFLVIS